MRSIMLSQEVSKNDALELANGVSVRSVLELFEALDSMDDETFFYHVSENHNDFSDWILENYHDEALSKKVLKIRSRKKLMCFLEKKLQEEIAKFVSGLEKKKAKKIILPKKKKEILKELEKI
ncbi:hypothetical protein D6829_02030 [Candidatus Pacearchaeota archaeon]|nr:MAG: hypothetical protein D6829_02030 [Candidatus Pacearchaeota archaeon]